MVTHPDQRAVADPLEPRLDGRPGQAGHVRLLLQVGNGGLADGGQIDEDVADPGGANGQRGRQRHQLILVLSEAAERRCDVDVGRRQDTGPVEPAQQVRWAQPEHELGVKGLAVKGIYCH